MRIGIDRMRCDGLGICEGLAPDHFQIQEDGTLGLLKGTVDDAEMFDVESAVHACPMEALSLVDE